MAPTLLNKADGGAPDEIGDHSTSRITPDKDSVVTEIFIAAPSERIFRALVDRDQALQWGSSPEFEMTQWEMDARLGGKWKFVAREREPSGAYSVNQFEQHGEILEIDPPRLLVYTWYANFHEQPAHKTTVHWELSSTPGGTMLKVTHSSLAQLPKDRDGYVQGWPGLLERIKQFTES